MRVDKFLKVSRLIKRRTVAKEACGKERISINGRAAKAGSEVKPGDIITIQYGNGSLSVKVLKIAESCSKEDAGTMYESMDGVK